MAHFAKVENGIVTEVLVVGNDQEHRGQDFLAKDLGLDGVWIKTSYNTIGNTHTNGGVPLHKNYAGIGFSWDGIGFFAPQPYPSWTKNEETYLWQPPIPYPTDGREYEWVESNLNWELVEENSESLS